MAAIIAKFSLPKRTSAFADFRRMTLLMKRTTDILLTYDPHKMDLCSFNFLLDQHS